MDRTTGFLHPWKSIPYRELLRAAEAHALDGDPTRPYLVLVPARGNGPVPDWDTLITALQILYDVLAHVGAVGGGLLFLKHVLDTARKRLGRGREVVQKHHTEWAERGARPDNFDRFLGQRPWLEEDLALLLGCSPEEARAVLWLFGFSQASNRLWRRAEDEAARLLDEAKTELNLSYAEAPQDFEKRLKEGAEILLRTGTRPRREWEIDN